MPDYKVTTQSGTREIYLVTADNRFDLEREIREGNIKPDMKEPFSGQMNIKEVKEPEDTDPNEPTF